MLNYSFLHVSQVQVDYALIVLLCRSTASLNTEGSHRQKFNNTFPVQGQSAHNISFQSFDSGNTSSFKPASHQVPSPADRIQEPEPVNYHMPRSSSSSPTKSSRHSSRHSSFIMVQQEQQQPITSESRFQAMMLPEMSTSTMSEECVCSPINPVQSDNTDNVQRSSSIIREHNPRLKLSPLTLSTSSIKEEWLQAYAGATVPEGNSSNYNNFRDVC